MSTTTETQLEARVGPSVTLAACADCACPTGRTRWLAFPCPGTIIGVVHDARTGDPIQGVNVWTESFANDNFGEVETDEVGGFHFASLEAAENYYFSMKAPGYSHRLIEEVTLPKDGLIWNVEMVRSGVIQGTIHNSSGQPVEGATVYMAQQNTSFGSAEDTLTDEDGHFCFCDASTNLDSKAHYSVLAVHPDYSFLQMVCDVPPYYSEGDEVVLQGVMEEMATVEGTLLVGGAPSADAAIYVLTDLSSLLTGDEPTSTDSNGFFSLRVHAPADYDFVVSPMNAFGFTQQITVSPGSTLTLPTFELPATGSVSGTITNSSGVPVQGALVELFASDDSEVPWGSALTGEAGHYLIENVPPFEGYILKVTMPGAQTSTGWPSQSDVGVVSNQTTSVNLTGDTEPPKCHIVSPTADQSVSGQVIVTVNVSDNEAVGAVLLRVGDSIEDVIEADDPDAPTPLQGQVQLHWDSALTNGSQTLTVEAFDLAGNRAQCSVTVDVNN